MTPTSPGVDVPAETVIAALASQVADLSVRLAVLTAERDHYRNQTTEGDAA